MNRFFDTRIVFTSLVVASLALLISGCSAMTPGNLNDVKPISSAPRAGNAYLLRGFIGIFSTGVDNLGNEINSQGVHAMVFQDDQWQALVGTIRKKYRDASNPEPLVLIGHSYGADDVVRIARELDKDHVKVDLLLTLDPVTPPSIPPNVQRCFNLYQSNGLWDKLPWLRGVAVEADKQARTEIVNANIRTNRTDLIEPGLDHFNIEKKGKIHQEIIKQVLATCPSRIEWLARSGYSPAQAASSTIPPRPVQPMRAVSAGAPAPRVASGHGN